MATTRGHQASVGLKVLLIPLTGLLTAKSLKDVQSLHIFEICPEMHPMLSWDFFFLKKNSNINKKRWCGLSVTSFFKELGHLEITLDSEQVLGIGLSQAMNQA